MKLRTLFGAMVLLLFCQNSRSQETRTLDLFLGYTYTRVSPSAISGLGAYPLQGGEVAASLRVYRRISAVADFGLGTTTARSSNIVGIQIHGTAATYLFGPRLTLPSWRRVTPFGQILLGLAHGTGGLYATGSSETSFAWAAGGGLDYRFNDNLSLRPIQMDYLQTRFAELGNGSQFQNDLRISTGLVLHF
ncbi:MAG TPA: hypothetical protein VK525_04765 [Candidatus Saccharimonadales bacterium]|nr:hypothetical protein [Candidatus Saccharimonadales bacterium]